MTGGGQVGLALTSFGRPSVANDHSVYRMSRGRVPEHIVAVLAHENQYQLGILFLDGLRFEETEQVLFFLF